MKTQLTRRNFLRHTGLISTGVLMLPNSRLVFAAEANDKLNVAGIGVAGQGGGNINNVAGLGVNLVAFADVDRKHAAGTFTKYPLAKVYADFRRMLDEMEKQIDAVVVSTPDHTHAVAATAAMNHGKHVYCEKPLTRTVHEARVMRETALKTRVVTQMGNQGSATAKLRRGVEMVWGGAIGDVREAYVWFDGGNGPQNRPAEQPPVPETLSWDLWLGPAQERPYNPCYLPAAWRNWRAFGSGIVGDFGCHTGNLMFRALKLDQLWNTAPAQGQKNVIRVEAKPSEVDQEGYPRSSQTVINIPARGELPPVKLTIMAKDKPSQDLMLGYTQGRWGDLLVGSKGSIYSDCPWNTRFILLPENKYGEDYKGPAESLPRSKGHHQEWIEACKGRGKTFSGFEIGGPLTELLQLVNLATLVEGPLDYDVAGGRILNSETAQKLVHREYRAGWKLG